MAPTHQEGAGPQPEDAALDVPMVMIKEECSDLKVGDDTVVKEEPLELKRRWFKNPFYES